MILDKILLKRDIVNCYCHFLKDSYCRLQRAGNWKVSKEAEISLTIIYSSILCLN